MTAQGARCRASRSWARRLAPAWVIAGALSSPASPPGVKENQLPRGIGCNVRCEHLNAEMLAAVFMPEFSPRVRQWGGPTARDCCGCFFRIRTPTIRFRTARVVAPAKFRASRARLMPLTFRDQADEPRKPDACTSTRSTMPGGSIGAEALRTSPVFPALGLLHSEELGSGFMTCGQKGPSGDAGIWPRTALI